MSEPAQAAVADDVRAQLRYAVDNGKPRLYEIGTPGTDRGADTGDHICYEVMIRDGRQADAAFSLEEHGFAFVTAPSQVIDFANEETIRSAYYAEAEQLVLAQTGGKRAQIFDHTVRHGDDAKHRALGLREPAFTVHNDHTHWSAPKRLRDILPSEAEDLLTRRFAIVQTWRPIGGPVASDPFAIADARSIVEDDYLAVRRHAPGRVGEIWHLKYNPDHRFYYLPHMSPDEVLVFKVYDSAVDGRARYAAHSAFSLPSTPSEAPPRTSIEVRMFVFF